MKNYNHHSQCLIFIRKIGQNSDDIDSYTSRITVDRIAQVSVLKKYDELDDWFEKRKRLSTDEITLPEHKEDIKDINRNTFYVNREGVVIREKPATADMIHSQIKEEDILPPDESIMGVLHSLKSKIEINKREHDVLKKKIKEVNEQCTEYIKKQGNEIWEINRLNKEADQKITATKRDRQKQSVIAPTMNFFVLPLSDKRVIKSNLVKSKMQQNGDELEENVSKIMQLRNQEANYLKKLNSLKHVVKESKYQIYQIIHELLEKGNNPINKCFSWAIREVWTLELKMDDNRMPKYLDSRSIKYLYSTAKREQEIERNKKERKRIQQIYSQSIQPVQKQFTHLFNREQIIGSLMHCSCQTTNKLHQMNELDLNQVTNTITQSFSKIRNTLNVI